ncbi:MAG: ADP-dependent glucokinase/phosphofructokinase, partial [Methanotrichaceae archaeon]|nr:ADP-dependent glucokinase/phosphofructokinase [Methanotrichaceae archaeon]
YKRQEVAGLIGKTFAWQNRLGGNAGNMANVLVQLGAEPVLNVPALTRRQASFLHPGVRVAKSDTLQPADVAAKEGEDLTHFVLQFSAGERVRTAEEIVVSPQENRFIASFDSLNRRLYTDPDFESYCRKHLDEMEGALIAGFHMVSFPCPEESVKERIEQIRSWKNRRPELFLHAEMGSIQRQEMMRCLLESLAVDSIGMNEDELAVLGGLEPGSRGILVAARRLRSHLGVSRVCVHTKEYVVSAVRDLIGPEDEISAIAQGVGMAATLAATGSISGERPSLNVNPAGTSAVNDFCREGARRSGSGAYIHHDNEFLCLVPALNVDNPKMTVGLGDSMTATTFFYELASRQDL